MRIMVLGNDANVSTLIKKLAGENSVSLVYTTMPENFHNQKVLKIPEEVKDIDEFINFAKENKIIFTIILDDEFLKYDISRKFALADLLVFSPDSESYSDQINKQTKSYQIKLIQKKFSTN